MRVRFRPTIATDFEPFNVARLPFRMQGITALADDRVIGLGGVGWRDGQAVCFCMMTDEARRYPMAIHRAGLLVMEMIRRGPFHCVLAEAEKGVPRAEEWLLRLGFRPVRMFGRRYFAWERFRHVE